MNFALSVQQTYNVLRAAGFAPELARKMVAIAQRESNLNPKARCTDCVAKPGGGRYSEDSLGLFQINMKGALGVARLKQFGLKSADELLQPSVSARAAFAIWGGRDSNLNLAWSIDRNEPFPFKTRFLALLAKLPAVAVLEAEYKRGGCSA